MASVVITGAEQRLGLALAREYADSGWEVFAGCLHPEAAGIRSLAGARGNIAVLTLDVTGEGSVAAFADRLAMKPLDLLINDAGIHRRKGSVPESVVFSDWEETLRVNTLGPARVSFALRPNLVAVGNAKLVTISSNWGSLTHHPKTAYDYCSAKAAVNSVMRELAANWSRNGITLLMIHPGRLRTAMGGADAPLMPEEGAHLVKAVIDGATANDNGRFLDHGGGDVAW
ncbi:MAG: SDR family NAD(P)-dependent oxidoreductase [Acetobacteraceae bacterium]